jgi:cytochrome bd ubiquinol oxidase subunit II
MMLFLAFTVAFGVAMYVVMDGFDLGLGILFLAAPGEADRDVMMNSIAPIWDGNETWLVLGGTLLIAAFPVAYATLLPAFYLPLIFMLLALVFRGIAFEFRFRAVRRRPWDWAFCGGSAVATLCQGVVLGGFIDGVAVAHGAFAGGSLDFLGVFPALCGLGLVAFYGLLGATWLILKTAGSTAAFGRRATRPLLVATLAFIALVSLLTPFENARIAHRWFDWPNIALLAPVPLITAATAWGIWRAAAGSSELRPFLLSILLFLLGYLGLGISVWPYAVPYQVTIWDAASSAPTLAFTAVGTAIILPVILLYLGYAHWVFRGKVGPGTGYGH